MTKKDEGSKQTTVVENDGDAIPNITYKLPEYDSDGELVQDKDNSDDADDADDKKDDTDDADDADDADSDDDSDDSDSADDADDNSDSEDSDDSADANPAIEALSSTMKELQNNQTKIVAALENLGKKNAPALSEEDAKRLEEESGFSAAQMQTLTKIVGAATAPSEARRSEENALQDLNRTIRTLGAKKGFKDISKFSDGIKAALKDDFNPKAWSNEKLIKTLYFAEKGRGSKMAINKIIKNKEKNKVKKKTKFVEKATSIP